MTNILIPDKLQERGEALTLQWTLSAFNGCGIDLDETDGYQIKAQMELWATEDASYANHTNVPAGACVEYMHDHPLSVVSPFYTDGKDKNYVVCTLV